MFVIRFDMYFLRKTTQQDLFPEFCHKFNPFDTFENIIPGIRMFVHQRNRTDVYQNEKWCRRTCTTFFENNQVSKQGLT